MTLKIFSIRDSKGEMYMQPFFQKTAGEAERSFRSLANDEKTMVCKHPEDFDLYYLGEYDDLTGKITGLSTPSHIAKAVNVVQQRPAQLAALQSVANQTQAVQ